MKKSIRPHLAVLLGALALLSILVSGCSTTDARNTLPPASGTVVTHSKEWGTAYHGTILALNLLATFSDTSTQDWRDKVSVIREKVLPPLTLANAGSIALPDAISMLKYNLPKKLHWEGLFDAISSIVTQGSQYLDGATSAVSQWVNGNP